MANIVKNKYYNNISSYIIASILLFSGISKCFYLQRFAEEVSQYSEFYVSSSFSPLSEFIAIALCFIEIIVGVLLFTKKLLFIAASMSFLLMSFFLYLTGINYLFPTVLGSIESCGCFGELIHFTAKGSFIKSGVLWLIALNIFISSIKNKQTILDKWRGIRKT